MLKYHHLETEKDAETGLFRFRIVVRMDDRLVPFNMIGDTSFDAVHDTKESAFKAGLVALRNATAIGYIQ